MNFEPEESNEQQSQDETGGGVAQGEKPSSNVSHNCTTTKSVTMDLTCDSHVNYDEVYVEQVSALD